jgi:REP element-mobilizing transposase RayT
MVKRDMNQYLCKRKKKAKEEYLLHIYNRGNHKENIGRQISDYEMLYEKILQGFDTKMFDVLCFCIMPNHYHILLKCRGLNRIHTVMQQFSSSYTKSFNKRNKVVGHLFQGSYKYKKVTNQLQLQILYKYIEKNPLEIGLHAEYPWLYKNDFLFDYYSLNFFNKEETV